MLFSQSECHSVIFLCIFRMDGTWYQNQMKFVFINYFQCLNSRCWFGESYPLTLWSHWDGRRPVKPSGADWSCRLPKVAAWRCCRLSLNILTSAALRCPAETSGTARPDIPDTSHGYCRRAVPQNCITSIQIRRQNQAPSFAMWTQREWPMLVLGIFLSLGQWLKKSCWLFSFLYCFLYCMWQLNKHLFMCPTYPTMSNDTISYISECTFNMVEMKPFWCFISTKYNKYI